jgi:lipopolysaccharide export system permease protein
LRRIILALTTLVLGVVGVFYFSFQRPFVAFRHSASSVNIERQNGAWRLTGVREVSPDGEAPPIHAATMLKKLPIEPSTIRLAGYREEELSYGDLMLLMDEELQLDQTTQPYQFWFHRKIAYPFSAFVMLLIAAPLALQLARRNRLFMASFISMMCALGFYVAQQLFASFGETGLLPPILAAWGPLIIAGAIGNGVLLHREN